MSAKPTLATFEGPPAAARGVDLVPLFLFGGRGMLGGELLRLLEHHPVLRLEALVSRSGGPSGHRQLAGAPSALPQDRAVERLATVLAEGRRAALVLALPHGESAELWPALARELGGLERLALVDLSADFRLRDAAAYQATYAHPHPAPDELARFAYGLPELYRAEIRAALDRGPARIAAPGCFATALQLAALPAARERIVRADAPWIFHAVTGSSGSGIEPKPETHHPHRHGNLWAYALGGHRHEAELAQALAPLGPVPALHFVPHSGPFARGIHLAAALPLERGVDLARARRAYADAYAGEPFVEVLAEGVPDLRMVAGSNRAALAVSVRQGVLDVLVTLDNLVKGGSGQALQCLNLALGLDEAVGLPRSGMGVC
jgi:N-acetyl-gamma-glutamyl-phosphate reductase